MKRVVLATAIFFLAFSFVPDTAEAAGCRLFSRLRQRVAAARCVPCQPCEPACCEPACAEPASADPTLPQQVQDIEEMIEDHESRLRSLEDK